MKVILDNIVFSLQKSGGVSTLWYELIKTIMNDNRFDVYFLEYANAHGNLIRSSFKLPEERILNLKNNSNVKIERYKNVRLNIEGPFIFVSSYYRYCKNKNAINVTIVHDFIYEYYKKGLAKVVHSFQKNNAIRNSEAIICISENTQKDLYKFVGNYNGEKKVIYNGFSDDFYTISNQDEIDPEILNLTNLIDGKYILYVGHRSYYKNFDLSVKSMTLLKSKGYKLVIVGEKLSTQEKEFIQNHLEPKDYLIFSRLPNAGLNYLYNNAFALLYLSSYEGFGIPLLEAMSAGCPTIAYNRSSIPEVAGDASLLLDNLVIENVTEAVEKLENKEFRDAIIAKGYQQCRKFGWDITMKAYCDYFESIYKKNAK